jgi:transposase
MKLNDFQRKRLQKALENPQLSDRNRVRIEIMLRFSDGTSQKEICRNLQCSPATARTWIQVVQSGQAHRWEEFCQDGRPKILEEHHCNRLFALVKYHSPKDFKFAFREWTAKALQTQLLREFNIKVSTRHINRVLKEAGLSRRKQGTQEIPPHPGIRIDDLHWLKDDGEAL